MKPSTKKLNSPADDIYIRGGHLIDPANGVDANLDIYIKDGKIAKIAKKITAAKNAQVIDARGLWILPGLVDLCVRAREPGDTTMETLATEARAAAAAGITRMVCPPDTFAVTDTPAMARMIQQLSSGHGGARAHPLGALTVNLDGKKLADIGRLEKAGCVGFSNGARAVENSLVMRRAMQYASAYERAVFVTPQDPWLQGNGVVHEGEVSTRLGLPAIPEAAETVGIARDLALVETSGARAHFQLLSCARGVAMLAEAQARNMPATASVAIHNLHLHEQHLVMFDTRYKVFPPLRTRADRDALINGVSQGVIAAICSDHQPQHSDAKLAPFAEAAAGISGVDTMLSLTLQLINADKISRTTAIKALTQNPAAIIGINAGHLSIGGDAELCLVDPKLKWQLNRETMHSFATNSPWFNKTLTGKNVATIINGEIVYRDPGIGIN